VGEGALRRFNECVKDALDPNGILAPGRNGIWPRRWRGREILECDVWEVGSANREKQPGGRVKRSY